jgi:streptogramin lyase
VADSQGPGRLDISGRRRSLDLASGKFENLGSFRDPLTNQTIGSYGIPADRDNNLYLLDFSARNIGKLDSKTGKFTVYRTPMSNSRARRHVRQTTVSITPSMVGIWIASFSISETSNSRTGSL